MEANDSQNDNTSSSNISSGGSSSSKSKSTAAKDRNLSKKWNGLVSKYFISANPWSMSLIY